VKIGLVVPGGVDRSGTERVIPALLWLIRRIARDHELHVFPLFQEDAPGEWDLLGAHVHNVGRGGTALRGLRTIRRHHRRAPFDVLHAIWASPCGALAVVTGRLLRVPVVVHLFGGELASLPSIGYGERRTWRGRVRVRTGTHGATRVTAQSEFLVAMAAACGIRARRLPLGVDRDEWPVAPPRPRDADRPFRLIHVADVNAVKDPDTLLAAMSILRQRSTPFYLDVVGEDLTGGRMRAEAVDLGLGDVLRFHGRLDRICLRETMLGADLLVMASRHEGGPIVLAEAAIAGVPTAGTHVGQIADWAPGAAVTAPVGSSTGLADAISRLMADEALRLRIAASAQRRAVAEDADWSAARIEELYREVASR